MFNRAQLKSNAKDVLKTNYWLSFAACILVNAISQFFSFNIPMPIGEDFNTASTELFKNLGYITGFKSSALFSIIGLGLILGIAFSIFIIFPLNVGLKRFFVKSADGKTEFSTIFDVFKTGVYLNTVKTMFMKNLFLLLWSLLFLIPYFLMLIIFVIFNVFADVSFENSMMLILSYAFSVILIIPYIIKYYLYYQVDYIIADDLNVNWRDAIKESKEMMKECKFKTFVLELSFVGWYFLGIMLLGIGGLFVNPYLQATLAQLYNDRKNTRISDHPKSKN